MVVPFDIAAEQERRWKELWGMEDDEWEAVWEYFEELAICRGAESEAELRYESD